MTYNVWSREDVAVYKRMKAIGSLVEKHKPDVIFFQEITPYILRIFKSFAWWKEYHCSEVKPEEQATKLHFCMMLSKIPMEKPASWKFTNTSTGRGYVEADINPGTSSPAIHIATTQLESPSSGPAGGAAADALLGAVRAGRARRRRAGQRQERRARRRHELGRRRRHAVPSPGRRRRRRWRLGRRLDCAEAGARESQCSTYDGIWNEDLAVFNGFTANAGLVAEEEIGPVRVQAAGLQAGRHRVDREYGKPRD
ncbi:hypothetical protein OsJ_24400 [Oryza sativa Japonica Group]|uniref:Endonuclease/exonuclease/phosphatase domain-containing protein n=1 Tax=Oryza sativa subsp. japonica TaxID=39947 RepID=B9FXG2_ORYSJ|nr:hypothetical protein OsJ_24400 [Oryza sativa Japonica Group]